MAEILIPQENLAVARTGDNYMIYIIRDEDRFLIPYQSVETLEEVEPMIRRIMAEGNQNPFSD